jgi:hypothetical protein
MRHNNKTYRNLAAAGSIAFVLAAAFATAASAAPLNASNRLADGFSQALLTDDVPMLKAVEPDPTDDGNIIIECSALNGAGRLAVAFIGEVQPVSMPQRPLGPTKCAPSDLRNVR